MLDALLSKNGFGRITFPIFFFLFFFAIELFVSETSVSLGYALCLSFPLLSLSCVSFFSSFGCAYLFDSTLNLPAAAVLISQDDSR